MDADGLPLTVVVYKPISQDTVSEIRVTLVACLPIFIHGLIRHDVN